MSRRISILLLLCSLLYLTSLAQTGNLPDSAQKKAAAPIDTLQQKSIKAAPADTSATWTKTAWQWLKSPAVILGAILIPLFIYIWKIIAGQTQLPNFATWWSRRKHRRRYWRQLKDEHEAINLIGFQASANIKVLTLEVFVALRLMEQRHGEGREAPFEPESELALSPAKVLQRAFFGKRPKRLLLIIGDPGSGKTTLMKYYVMCSLDQAGRRQLGLPQPLWPIFAPLRLVDPDQKFCATLSEAAASKNKPLPPDLLEDWLENRGALVLLDGLDEISEVARRRRVCRWIEQACRDYPRSHFVVTSRYTGYRVTDDVELRIEHLRADVQDLNDEQKAVFLKNWFAAVDQDEAAANAKASAEKIAGAILAYLAAAENGSLGKLAGTPVLLQLMAILWKEYGTLVSGRAGLYEKCTDYLLDRRERVRDIPPPLPAEQAKIILRPLALFMQETLQTHDISAAELTERLERPLQDVQPNLSPTVFLEHLRDRAGLLKTFGDSRYVFSHHSFREFLAAGELAEQIKSRPDRAERLVENTRNGWWRETLLFSLSLTKPAIFTEFFERFLPHAHNNPDAVTLLETIIKEAPHKPVQAFENFFARATPDWQKRYNALLCLRLIASAPAKALVQKIWEQEKEPHVKQKAAEILLEWKLRRPEAPAATRTFGTRAALPNRILNPFELEAEYLLIPGGKYTYSVTEKEVAVPPIYFAKYPVTNKLYRRFIDYLDCKENMSEVLAVLPPEKFAKSLFDKIESNAEFVSYLEYDVIHWGTKLRPRLDRDKRFNGDNQPVVAVTWFGEQAYCHWLTAVETFRRNVSTPNVSTVFRLPTEIEWEWAASGGKRKYPWGNEEPDEARANYDNKLGQTAPVDTYPAGATPEGLMDMAGNVWEWTEKLFQRGKAEKWWAAALCGGSWSHPANNLSHTAREYSHPGNRNVTFGFRVIAVPS